MEIRYCQKVTEDGLQECGFLCGAYCRADPNNPFYVSGDFHDKLKKVGCQSWQRYLDYGERRERFGENPGKGSTKSGTESGTERTDGGIVPVPELPVKQELAVHRGRGEEAPAPMRVLQTGCDAGLQGDSAVEQPVGRSIGTCSFCKEPATTVDMGVRYCRVHAEKMGL